MPSLHSLPFLAPIPRGHDVLVVTFTLDNRSPTVVLDRTASSLYFADELWGALQQDPFLAVRDPIAVVTRWAWTVRSAIEGVCAGAMLSTKTVNASYEAKTLLLVEPASTTAPYR